MSDVSLAKDIIVEILSRLPVKSLLRFKCVCKEWYQLIESPVFISKHFNRETNHSCLLVQYIPNDGVLSHFAFFPDKDLKGTPPAYQLLYKQLELEGQLYGPVNGLFLLHIVFRFEEDVLALWNPATRQLRHISYPKLTLPPQCSVDSQVFGFGFDRSNNDYKVIWFCSFWDNKKGKFYLPGQVEVKVYSLSKGSWNLPVTMNCHPLNSLCNTYINGAYYWLSWSRIMTDHTPRRSILSFDMANEVFRDIQGPGNNLDDRLWGPEKLMLYNDHLALLLSDNLSLDDQIFFYIWIMEEEGRWMKLLAIGPCQDLEPARGIWNNNEILILTTRSGRLLLCNVDGSENKDLGLETDPDEPLLYTYSYKESLVSIKGGADDWGAFDSHAEFCNSNFR